MSNQLIKQEGGALKETKIKMALIYLKMKNIVARNKYKAYLAKLNETTPNNKFTPYKRKRNGDLTNIIIKEGTPAWKKEIENEILRRYEETKKAEIIRKAREKEERRNRAPPVLINGRLIKKYGRYEKYVYTIANAENIKDKEEFYNIIKKADNALGGGSYATIVLSDYINGKARMISIKASYLDNYGTFIGRIEDIAKGAVVGSDPFTDNEDAILYHTFYLSKLDLAHAEGESDKIIFKCQNIKNDKKLCGYECLKLCGFDYDKRETEITPKELKDVKKMVEVIRKHRLNISIVCNGIRLNKKILEIISGEDKLITKEKVFYDTPRRKCEMRFVNKLKRDEWEYQTFKTHDDDVKFNFDEPNFTIIYDDVGKHFDLPLNNEIELKDELRISASMELILNGDVVLTAKQSNRNTLDVVFQHYKYIFFDYETVMDFNMDCCMKPYSLSILVLTDKELIKLEEKDLEKNEEAVKAIREAGCKTFLGYNCSELFINWFMENSHDTSFTLVGFNNSNFDNFILLDALLNFDMVANKTEFTVNNVFYNGSQLLNFTIDGRHSLFDIRKHLVGSLKANCEAFKINCCSKKSFEHSKAQLLHEDGKLIDFITDNDELKEYNEYDVLATAVLFRKYQNALSEIEATKPYAEKLKNTITIGSLIWDVFKNHTEALRIENIKLLEQKEKDKYGEKLSPLSKKVLDIETKKPFFGKLTYEQYKDLQKYKIAGRVELFNGIMETFERMASTDVCSLYPFVMAVLNVYYPYGDIINVECYQPPAKNGDVRIGFYYCDIDQSNLKKENKPKIYARKTEIENDWDYGDGIILKNYLISSVMIELLLKHGCKVEIKNGFVFKNKMKSCKMFSFILQMMGAKNKQDVYKDSEDPVEQEKYIAPLRETLKLLQNSLSGKVIEGLHTEKTKDCANCAEYDEIRADKSTKSINFINCVGNRLFVTVEIDEESICEKEQRPIFLGCLIYDYAKRYMYEYSYSKIGLKNLVYTDTDASKFKYKCMDDWRKWIEAENIIVPHWKEVETVDERYKTHLIYNPSSKVYGSFEDELEKMIGDKYAFYCLEKKSWAYAVLNNDDTIAKKFEKGKLINNSKFKFKGVGGQSIILTAEEPFIEEIKVNHKKENRIETIKRIKNDTEKEVYLYSENNKDKAIEYGNEIKFFQQLYNTGEAYLLTNSFRKIVKNSSRNVVLGDEDKYNGLINKIQVNFTMKHIQIRPVQAQLKEREFMSQEDINII